MKKKILSLMLIAALTASMLLACGSDAAAPTAPEPEPAAEAAEEPAPEPEPEPEEAAEPEIAEEPKEPAPTWIETQNITFSDVGTEHTTSTAFVKMADDSFSRVGDIKVTVKEISETTDGCEDGYKIIKYVLGTSFESDPSEICYTFFNLIDKYTGLTILPNSTVDELGAEDVQNGAYEYDNGAATYKYDPNTGNWTISVNDKTYDNIYKEFDYTSEDPQALLHCPVDYDGGVLVFFGVASEDEFNTWMHPDETDDRFAVPIDELPPTKNLYFAL